MSYEEIKNYVIERLQKNNSDNLCINDDTMLLESGLIDSLGFLGLMCDIEKKFSIELDFSEKDPSEYLSVGGFLASVREFCGEENDQI